MFFKELACFILFSYQCSFAVRFVCNSFIILSCVSFFVNNFFQLFFDLIFALSKKALKTYRFLLVCCCVVQQPWLIYTHNQQKSTLFFKIFPKGHFDQYAQFNPKFLCILYTTTVQSRILHHFHNL